MPIYATTRCVLFHKGRDERLDYESAATEMKPKTRYRTVATALYCPSL